MVPLTSADRRAFDSRVARLLRLPAVAEERGTLTWAEYPTHLPFTPLRFWIIHGIPPGGVRGNHAHRKLHEFLVCVHGSCAVTLDDGTEVREIVLDAPDLGLYVPPAVWNTQHRFSSDAVLVVWADGVYRADDYIRDYAEFLALVRA